MVRRIVSDGHELASHGYAHERANALEADAFFADVAASGALGMLQEPVPPWPRETEPQVLPL